MSFRELIPFFLTWGLPFTAWVFVQFAAAVTLRARGRLLSLVPILPMVVVCALTASAYRQQSNLWPILLIFAGPVALIYVAVVWFTFSKRKEEPSRG